MCSSFSDYQVRSVIYRVSPTGNAFGMMKRKKNNVDIATRLEGQNYLL
jgi:hypothetical protein